MNFYDELKTKYGLINESMVGKNELGENVIVSIDDNCACVRTLQNNGWARINLYYKDGTCEELYQK